MHCLDSPSHDHHLVSIRRSQHLLNTQQSCTRDAMPATWHHHAHMHIPTQPYILQPPRTACTFPLNHKHTSHHAHMHIPTQPDFHHATWHNATPTATTPFMHNWCSGMFPCAYSHTHNWYSGMYPCAYSHIHNWCSGGYLCAYIQSHPQLVRWHASMCIQSHAQFS
jgi:hypothetical protein